MVLLSFFFFFFAGLHRLPLTVSRSTVPFRLLLASGLSKIQWLFHLITAFPNHLETEPLQMFTSWIKGIGNQSLCQLVHGSDRPVWRDWRRRWVSLHCVQWELCLKMCLMTNISESKFVQLFDCKDKYWYKRLSYSWIEGKGGLSHVGSPAIMDKKTEQSPHKTWCLMKRGSGGEPLLCWHMWKSAELFWNITL